MRQSPPPLITALGILLLVIGVVLAVRAKPQKSQPSVIPVTPGS